MAANDDPRGVGVYNFSEKLKDEIVYFSVLRLKQSFVLWMGTQPTMQGLAVAMRVPSDKEPACVPLLGPSTDVYSTSLAQRLAKKTGCQCFVSVNISDHSLIPEAEEVLLRQLDQNQSYFYIS